MSRYKIHIDPPNPDPDKIRHHQNFDDLFRDYRAVKRFDFWRNLYRDPKLFAGLAAAIAVMVLVFQAANEDVQDHFSLPAGAPIAAPLSPDQTWTLDAMRDTTIILSDQWSLHIPAGSVLDSSGNPWQASYQLSYRSLDDPAEQFLSGAFGANQPFWISASTPDADLQAGTGIELRSSQQVDQPGFFQDTQWLASAELPAQTVLQAGPGPKPVVPALLHEYEEAGSKPIGNPPQRPGKPFGIEVDNLSDFPQFRGYQQVFWEHIPTPETSDPWSDGLINDTMSQVLVRPFREDSYELRFTQTTPSGGIIRKRVIARPYLGVQTESQVNNLYQDRMEDYQVALEAWNEAREERNRMIRLAEEARREYEQELGEWEQAVQEDTGAVSIRIHRWALASFGILGTQTAQANGQDSVSLRLEVDSDGQVPKALRVFVLDRQAQQLVEAKRKGEQWLLPSLETPDLVWAYDAEQIWTADISITDGTTLSASLTLLPANLTSTEDILRHLQGVL